nr:GAF domain-containing protein [uncultured Desulfuromonas sp.]
MRGLKRPQRRLLIAIVVFIAVVGMFFAAFWYAAVIPHYDRLEQREARYSATVVKLAFERKITNLEQLVAGYAAGSGRQLMDNDNALQGWENLFDQQMLEANQLSAVIILSQGQCLFKRVSEQSSPNLSLDTLLPELENAWQQRETSSLPVAGFFSDPRHWYLIAEGFMTAPAPVDSGQTFQLIFLRVVDEAFVYQLSRQFRFRFQVLFPLSADLWQNKLSSTAPVIVEEGSSRLLHVWFKLQDVSQNREALVQIFFPREYIFEMQRGSFLHLSVIWGVFTVLAVIMMMVVRKTVKKPYRELLNKILVLDVHDRLDVSGSLDKNFVRLGGEFNRLLDTLEQCSADQRCSDKKVELIQQVVPCAIFTVDEKKVITSWNECATRLTGYKAEEMIGNICFLFAEKPCHENCGLFDDMIEKPIMGRECTIRRKDGQLIRISKNVDFLKDARGRVIGGIECFEAVSPRHSSDEALQWELALNIRLAHLSRAILHAPDSVEKIAEELLEHARNLTGSPQGFVALRRLEEPQSFLAMTSCFSEICLNASGEADRKTTTNRHSLFNSVYHYRDGVCFNNLDSLSSLTFTETVGERISHFMAVPILNGEDELIGQLALANKAGGYMEQDQQGVEQLVELFSLVLINRK